MEEPKLTYRDWISAICFIIFLISETIWVVGFFVGKAYPYAFICSLFSLFIAGMFHRHNYWIKYNYEKEWEEKHKDDDKTYHFTVKIS